VVGRTGQTDDGGSGVPGQLHRDRPDPARRAGHDDRVSLAGRHGPDRGVRRRTDDEQCTGRLPGDVARPVDQMAGLGGDEVGVARAVVREPEDLVTDREVRDTFADLVHDPGEITALSGREGRGPPVVQQALADARLPRVDTRGPHPDEDLAGTGDRPVHLHDPQNADLSVHIESHSPRHREAPFICSRWHDTYDAATIGGT
jgi:hypothetical protein